MINRLKNEARVCQSTINKLKDEVNTGIVNRYRLPYIKQNQINNLKETLQLAMIQKKRCKHLIAQALISEVRTE